MYILNQPYDSCLGNILIEKLQLDFSQFVIVSAYAKDSGVLRLKPSIENFRNSGGSVRSFIGIDQNNTSYEALLNLFHLCNELFIIHSESKSTTFHQKLYLLNNEPSAWLAIGSNNLTGGGLWTNYESSMIFEYNLSIDEHIYEHSKISDLLLKYSDPSFACSRKMNSIEDINRLLDNGYILKEFDIRTIINSTRKSSSQSAEKLFGNENFSAPKFITKTKVVQQKSIPIKSKTIKSSPIIPAESVLASNEQFWFEMRASTGGSRNILDLSMMGKIAGGSITGTRYATDKETQMLGGVAFFDVNPSDHSIIKNITINFEGIDYFPSTLRFTPNNGSWRLQLKGNNEDNTQALSEFGRSMFFNNILLFEKIRTDYYVLSVIDGNRLDEIKAISYVYAHNGINKSSKFYGMLP